MALYISHKCLHCLQTARTWQKRHIHGWQVYESVSGIAFEGSSGGLLAEVCSLPQRGGRGSRASQQFCWQHPPRGLFCLFHHCLVLLGHPGHCSGQIIHLKILMSKWQLLLGRSTPTVTWPIISTLLFSYFFLFLLMHFLSWGRKGG